MQRLLQFLYRYRAFLLFLFLEVLSFWLVIENNSYQGSKYFNSANAVVASINESSQGVRDFIDLSNQNQILAEENSNSVGHTKSLPVFHEKSFPSEIKVKCYVECHCFGLMLI